MQQKHNTKWRPWGDYPVVVIIMVIGTLIGILSWATGTSSFQELRNKLLDQATAIPLPTPESNPSTAAPVTTVTSSAITPMPTTVSSPSPMPMVSPISIPKTSLIAREYYGGWRGGTEFQKEINFLVRDDGVEMGFFVDGTDNCFGVPTSGAMYIVESTNNSFRARTVYVDADDYLEISGTFESPKRANGIIRRFSNENTLLCSTSWSVER